MHVPLILPMNNGPPPLSLPENADSLTQASEFMQLLEGLMAENQLSEAPVQLEAMLLESLEVDAVEDETLLGQIAAYLALLAAPPNPTEELVLIQDAVDEQPVEVDLPQPITQNLSVPQTPLVANEVDLPEVAITEAGIPADRVDLAPMEVAPLVDGAANMMAETLPEESPPVEGQIVLDEIELTPKVEIPPKEASQTQEAVSAEKTATTPEVSTEQPQPVKPEASLGAVQPNEQADQSEIAMDRQPQEMDLAPKGDPAITESPDLNIEQGFATNVEAVAASRSKPAEAGEAVSQVFRAVETMVQEGQNMLQIHLHPEELGAIDLRLTRGEDGLQVSFRADVFQTQVLLERHLDELRQHLSRAGISLDHLSVGGQSRQGQEQDAPFRQPRRRPAASYGELSALDAQIQEEDILQRSDFNVDYRI